MSDTPYRLRAPDAPYLEALFAGYWQTLEALAALLRDGELILAEERVHSLRALILDMMLAANGIERPAHALSLNRYLGESQRIALEKTLVARGTARESIVAGAVALTVIYQWYAPQLVERYGVVEPDADVQRVYDLLAQGVPEWPLTIQTE